MRRRLGRKDLSAESARYEFEPSQAARVRAAVRGGASSGPPIRISVSVWRCSLEDNLLRVQDGLNRRRSLGCRALTSCCQDGRQKLTSSVPRYWRAG
jgi:hypothetical protein